MILHMIINFLVNDGHAMQILKMTFFVKQQICGIMSFFGVFILFVIYKTLNIKFEKSCNE